MEQFFNIVGYCVTGGITVLVVIALIRFLGGYFNKTVTAHAAVIDKRESSYENVLPNMYPTSSNDFIVVFNCNNRTISFRTSLWNYDAVKVGQHGTLKYKGNRLISFKPD